MIDESANRKARLQLRRAAHVVRVKVSDDQVVDLRDAGVSGRCHDAVRVTAFMSADERGAV
jgi:hypothetical protein